jgi:hypothetical protein
LSVPSVSPIPADTEIKFDSAPNRFRFKWTTFHPPVGLAEWGNSGKTTGYDRGHTRLRLGTWLAGCSSCSTTVSVSLNRDTRKGLYGTHSGVDGRQGSARMLILVTAMFLLPLVLVALYLYVHGVFTKGGSVGLQRRATTRSPGHSARSRPSPVQLDSQRM